MKTQDAYTIGLLLAGGLLLNATATIVESPVGISPFFGWIALWIGAVLMASLGRKYPPQVIFVFVIAITMLMMLTAAGFVLQK